MKVVSVKLTDLLFEARKSRPLEDLFSYERCSCGDRMRIYNRAMQLYRSGREHEVLAGLSCRCITSKCKEAVLIDIKIRCRRLTCTAKT